MSLYFVAHFCPATLIIRSMAKAGSVLPELLEALATQEPRFFRETEVYKE